MMQLKAGIEHTRTPIDRELLQRLKRGVTETEQAKQDMAAFREATQI